MTPVKGYEGLYSITEEGTVYSHRSKGTGKRVVDPNHLYPLKPRLGKRGYLVVSLWDNNKKVKTKYLHRLLMQAFTPNPNNLPAVNHKNGNKTDCRLYNLEWVTTKQNCHHAISIGTVKLKNEDNPYAKLSNSERLFIVGNYVYGHSCIKLAKAFKVTRSCVTRIVKKNICGYLLYMQGKLPEFSLR